MAIARTIRSALTLSVDQADDDADGDQHHDDAGDGGERIEAVGSTDRDGDQQGGPQHHVENDGRSDPGGGHGEPGVGAAHPREGEQAVAERRAGGVAGGHDVGQRLGAHPDAEHAHRADLVAGVAQRGAGEEGIRPPRADLQADAAEQQQRLDVEQLRRGPPEAGDQREDEEVEDEDEEHRLDAEVHGSERLARRRHATGRAGSAGVRRSRKGGDWASAAQPAPRSLPFATRFGANPNSMRPTPRTILGGERLESGPRAARSKMDPSAAQIEKFGSQEVGVDLLAGEYRAGERVGVQLDTEVLGQRVDVAQPALQRAASSTGPFRHRPGTPCRPLRPPSRRPTSSCCGIGPASRRRTRRRQAPSPRPPRPPSWSAARAARKAALARPSWLRNSGFVASVASANIGTLPDARAMISSSAPAAMPTATAPNAIVDRHSSGIRISVKSSSGGSKIENDRVVGDEHAINREVVTARAAHPHRRPRVDDLDVGGGEHHHPQRRHPPIVDEAVGEEPLGVPAPAGERPSPAGPKSAVDGRRLARRIERPGTDHVRAGGVDGIERRRRQVAEQRRRRRADHHRPSHRPVGLGQLLDHREGVGEGELVTAVTARHERPEAAGGDEVVDEVAGQRARLLDLVDAGRDVRHQGAHRVEGASAVRSWSSPVPSDHCTEHVDERLGLFEGGVVGGVLDDVQRPAERSAGRFGHAQRGGQVVATPDQRRRHGDAGQRVRRDLGDPRSRPSAHPTAANRAGCWRRSTA